MNIDPTVWEGLFIRIKDLENQKDLVFGNIYRPPHDNNNQININTFVTVWDPMLSSLTNNKDDFLIAGDFHINLLQINVVNKEHYAQFLDLMLAYSLFPKITFPTRTSESGSCTLIDNIFCKLSKETLSSIAGILYTSISDHYPYFLSFSRSKNRGITSNCALYIKQHMPAIDHSFLHWIIYYYTSSFVHKRLKSGANLADEIWYSYIEMYR